MAAPVTPVLDNFNRADSTTTLGPNWTQFTKTIAGELGNEGIISNQAYNPSTQFNNYTGMMWNPTTFGPDCEGYMTISTMPTINNGDDGPAIDLRITQPGSTYQSYHLGLRGDAPGLRWNIGKSVNGTESDITVANATVSSGDKMWFTAIGNVLTGYQYINTSGSWSQVIQVTDTTYAGVSGNIGLYFPGNNINGIFDDFGGGNIQGFTGSFTFSGNLNYNNS